MVCRACGGLCVHDGHLARPLLREDEERWFTDTTKINLRYIRNQLHRRIRPNLEVKCAHCQQWLTGVQKGMTQLLTCKCGGFSRLIGETVQKMSPDQAMDELGVADYIQQIDRAKAHRERGNR